MEVPRRAARGVQCPVCRKMFPQSKIMSHADACAATSFGNGAPPAALPASLPSADCTAFGESGPPGFLDIGARARVRCNGFLGHTRHSLRERLPGPPLRGRGRGRFRGRGRGSSRGSGRGRGRGRGGWNHGAGAYKRWPALGAALSGTAAGAAGSAEGATRGPRKRYREAVVEGIRLVQSVRRLLCWVRGGLWGAPTVRALTSRRHCPWARVVGNRTSPPKLRPSRTR